ncbi:MAG: hypothetical protein H7061_04695 [Bdellovibrionaceae bacterium]|nr:hypothetical protein [Bdellovibrio sp.]
MRKNVYDVIQFLKFIRGHVRALFYITFAVLVVFVLAAKLFIPVKYKSFSVITIPTRYFQQPAVEDILPPVNDQQEMKTLRESLVRNALGNQFLENTRQKFQLFPSQTEDSSAYEKNMQSLMKQFEIISLNLTSFQVGYVGSEAEKTHQMTMAAQAAVVEHIISERSKKLTSIRDNLLAKIDSLGFNINEVADPLSTSRPEILRGELQGVRGMIASLSGRYTNEHPMVKKYRQRENLIVTYLAKNQIPIQGTVESRKDTKGLSSSSFADEDRYTDLLKQVDRLNLLIDYEERDAQSLAVVAPAAVYPLQPISPKLPFILFWAMLSAMILCAIYLSLKSFLEIAASPTARLASQMNLNYLGKIPDLRAEFLKSLPDQKKSDQQEMKR